MTHPQSQQTTAELEARLAELNARQEAATSWGAAVGARHEEIKGIESELKRRAVQRPYPDIVDAKIMTDNQFKIALSALIEEALAAGLDHNLILNNLRLKLAFEERMKEEARKYPGTEAFQ